MGTPPRIRGYIRVSTQQSNNFTTRLTKKYIPGLLFLVNFVGKHLFFMKVNS